MNSLNLVNRFGFNVALVRKVLHKAVVVVCNVKKRKILVFAFNGL